MPSTLVAAQKIALYEILEVPYFTRVNRLVGSDNTTYEARDVAGSVRAAKDAIEEHLTALGNDDPDAEAVLKGYLDEWVDMGIEVYRIDQGSIGNISGVSDSSDERRTEIRRRVLVIVPFYREHEELQHSKGSSNIRIIR